MNSIKVILALWLGATAWGQVKLPQPQANPPVAAPSKAAPATSPSVAPKAVPVSKSATAQRKTRGTSARHVRHASLVRHVSKPVRTVSSEGAKPTGARKGRRDPFVSPVVDRSHAPIVCTGTGKQCLEVGDVSLHGVVHGATGYIAVVVNGEHTYFLRVNDPLANGQVERITKDSIVLRERYSDDLGRPGTREVTRKLSQPPV